MKHKVTTGVIYLGVGMGVAAVVLGLNLPSNDPTGILALLILPFYLLGVLFSGNPHAPNGLVIFVGAALLFAIGARIISMIICRFVKKREMPRSRTDLPSKESA